MTILVTGGSGFIGTQLCAELLSLGHAVRIFDLKQSQTFPDLCIQGDVRDLSALSDAAQGVSTVFHLAAEHRDDVEPISLYTDVNVGGARNLLHAVRNAGCRHIVFTSSVAVYSLNAREPDENTDPAPFNPYGRTKLEAERVLREWAQEDNAACLTIVRPCVVFGPTNRGNVFNLIDQIQRGRFIMIGDGNNRKSMAFVGNLSSFLASRVDAPCGIHLFNYADKPDLKVSDIVTIVSRALSREPRRRDNVRIPFSLGLLAGYAFDVASLITGTSLPLSSIRIRKFCAETTVRSERVSLTGFQPRYRLETALEHWVKEEFSGSDPFSTKQTHDKQL